jgi:two-component system KDP operon response regulator KdpE
MKKALIIDDEASIRKFLRVSLEAHQFQVREAATGHEGIQETLNSRPEVIILDLGLPDQNGLDVIRAIREWSTTPIIVLTVQDREEDKISALDLGADDYLTKPFSVPELLARIRVALRHNLPKNENSKITLGELEIDLLAHLVKVSGQTIKLTATEYEILKLLAKNAGRVVTHRQLLKTIWGPNAVEHTQYLRVYLGQIRKKLQINESLADFIQTEAGVGYRLLRPETE